MTIELLVAFSAIVFLGWVIADAFIELGKPV